MGGGHLGGGGRRGGRGVSDQPGDGGPSYLRYALAMRARLPEVAALFRAGDIDYRLFATVVYRTDLITDEQVLAAVDAEVALKVVRWPSMTRGRLAGQVDQIVARADADAVRRQHNSAADRGVWIGDSEGGLAEIGGGLFAADAHALQKRLAALAATGSRGSRRSRFSRFHASASRSHRTAASVEGRD